MRGRPTSANGASSLHLWWQLPPGTRLREVEATLTVTRPPARRVLYFWALQVNFVHRGRELGGAHTGLQWHPAAPRGAVNWGGYFPGAGELPGTVSALPEVDSANTRAWEWLPGRPYRIRVWSPERGRWRSTITDGVDGRSADVRDLIVDAEEAASPVVWSEVFADCDDPPVEVVWSDLGGTDRRGVRVTPTAARATYEAAAGGCANTESRALPGGRLAQVTGLADPRSGRDGDMLELLW